VIGIVLTAVHLPRLARTCGVDPAVAGWLGAASPLVLVHLLAGAHHDALTLGLLLAGLDLATRRRGWQAGVALGLAAAVKATAVIALPFAVVLAAAAFPARRRLVSGTAVVVLPAVAVFVALSVAGGLGPGWIRGAPGPHSVIHWLSVPTSIGLVLGGLAALAGMPDALPTIVPAVRMAAWYVLLPAVLAGLWWRIRHSTDPRRVVTAAGLAVAAAVLLSPLVYPWYYAAPIAILAAAADGHRVRALLAAIALFGLFVILPDGINLAHVTKWPGAVVEVAALTGLAAWWLVARTRRGAAATASDRAGRRRPDRRAAG
jgi:4-amino-4-deoxy-L-arabinose transferase-like glycosyltransferase